MLTLWLAPMTGHLSGDGIVIARELVSFETAFPFERLDLCDPKHHFHGNQLR